MSSTSRLLYVQHSDALGLFDTFDGAYHTLRPIHARVLFCDVEQLAFFARSGVRHYKAIPHRSSRYFRSRSSFSTFDCNQSSRKLASTAMPATMTRAYPTRGSITAPDS